MCPIVLVTNIIITLNAINYFTKTFITDIWQDRKSASTFWKKKNITFNFPWIIHQYPCFSWTFWVFWAFCKDKRKIEKQQKNEICNRNADLPCWWPRICWKTHFRFCSLCTCYTKNIDRILKCLDRLGSNFQKLVNLRLTTFTFWNPGFMTLNLKVTFQNY